ncbi:MAG: DUF447 family protein [Planctomycetaceae bacterium]|nr:DUF447 family protein [Planctomycetaceae bacterium]
MILEGILTTTNVDSSVNIAPMGPIVDESMSRLLLRPFQTSLTFANLRRTGQGVFHVVDRVDLLARAALGPVDPLPPMSRANTVDGWILSDACRWYAVQVEHLDDSRPRAEMDCRVVESGKLRDFFGFNRARHAVLEAAILATRVNLLPLPQILAELAKLRVIVDKTGDAEEQAAFEFVERHVQNAAPRLDLVDITG